MNKKVKIVIRYTRSKLIDSKTQLLPAASPQVRQSLYNSRILSGLLRELPRAPPTPPSSRLNSESSTSSGISSNSGSRVLSSHPPPLKSVGLPPVYNTNNTYTNTNTLTTKSIISGVNLPKKIPIITQSILIRSFLIY